MQGYALVEAGTGRFAGEGSAGAAHVASLDGWRGLSLLLVFIGHFTAYYEAAALGVELFFVLSGRLMADILILRREPIGTFFWRRASRILPVLWLYIAVVFVGLTASGLYQDGGRDNLAGALAAFSFTSNYVDPRHITFFYDHTWSLAVEEHCYLVLGLIAALVARSRRQAVFVAIVLSLLAILNGLRLEDQLASHNPYLYFRTDIRGASVLLAFAGRLLLHDRCLPANLPGRGLIAPGLLILGMASTMLPDALRYSLGTLVLVAAVNSVDSARGGYRRLLEMPVIGWIGTMSFSLYIWQQPFYGMHRNGVSVWLCLGLAAACGMWSHYAVERPARRWLNAHKPRWPFAAARRPATFSAGASRGR
jgi:peptidoglycan/LPS O-acetylase OafA/YrhL